MAVYKGADVRKHDSEDREWEKIERRKRDREAAAQIVYQDIMDAFIHNPNGLTKTKARERVGQGKTFDAAWLRAVNSGELVECKVKGANGQDYDGWKRKHADQD